MSCFVRLKRYTSVNFSSVTVCFTDTERNGIILLKYRILNELKRDAGRGLHSFFLYVSFISVCHWSCVKLKYSSGSIDKDNLQKDYFVVVISLSTLIHTPSSNNMHTLTLNSVSDSCSHASISTQISHILEWYNVQLICPLELGEHSGHLCCQTPPVCGKENDSVCVFFFFSVCVYMLPDSQQWWYSWCHYWPEVILGCAVWKLSHVLMSHG